VKHSSLSLSHLIESAMLLGGGSEPDVCRDLQPVGEASLLDNPIRHPDVILFETLIT